MRESNWYKRVDSFKRRIASTLVKATARFEHDEKGGAAPNASEQAARRTASSTGDEQSDQSLPPVPTQSAGTPGSRGVDTPGPQALQSAVEHHATGDSPTSYLPAVDGVNGTPPDDESRIEVEHSASPCPENAADGAPREASIPDRVAPARGVETNSIELMDTQAQTLDSLYDSSISWSAGRLKLLESVSATETGTCRRFLAFADSENVVTPVTDTLRYAGVVKKNGELKRRAVRDLTIVHTGDMILKHRPDPTVVDYWLDLEERLERLGGELVLLAGNHELEVLDCLQRGQRLGMKRRQCEQVEAFVKRCRLFHLSGSVMFIHGYPTLNLLRRLKRFQERTGLSIDQYHEQFFQPAFDDPGELAHYRYLRGKGTRKLLLHDLVNPANYYRIHGREIAALLRYFGIERVIHGHRPERSGIQADYEFRHWLPGIRMIGNDTQLRQRGLGAVVMRMDSDDDVEVLLVNDRTSSDQQRRSVKRLLREKSPRQPSRPMRVDASRIAAAMTANQRSYQRADIRAL